MAWQGRLFSVVLSDVTYPDGSVHRHEEIRAPDVVRVYAVERNSVLLTSEARPGSRDRVTRVPAGRIEEGESPEEAARRELLEETGYQAQDIKLIRTCSPILKFRHRVHHYLATSLTRGAQSLQHGEDIQVGFVPIAAARAMVFEGSIPEDTIAMTLLLIHEANKEDSNQV